MITLDNLPAEIRESARCVVWNYEERDDGKRTKIPYQARRPGVKASSTDSATWATLSDAYAAYLDGKADGVGWVPIAGVVGVDLDHCLDPITGTIAPEARTIIEDLTSYTEITPSGTGLRVYVRGTLPPQGRVKTKGTVKIEMYDGGGGRYFTVTGHHLDGTPTTIEDRTPQLAALHARLFGSNGNGQRPTPQLAAPVSEDDATLLDRAKRARNGDKFAALWAGDTRSGEAGDGGVSGDDGSDRGVLADSCVIEQGASVGATDLYRAYVAWCEAAKEHPESQRRFGEALTERGFVHERHRRTKRWLRHGLRLTTDGTDGTDPLPESSLVKVSCRDFPEI